MPYPGHQPGTAALATQSFLKVYWNAFIFALCNKAIPVTDLKAILNTWNKYILDLVHQVKRSLISSCCARRMWSSEIWQSHTDQDVNCLESDAVWFHNMVTKVNPTDRRNTFIHIIIKHLHEHMAWQHRSIQGLLCNLNTVLPIG
jgi:hypothetical protein